MSNFLKRKLRKVVLDNYPETYFFVIFWTRATDWRTATKNQNGIKTSKIDGNFKHFSRQKKCYLDFIFTLGDTRRTLNKNK